tara:strand:+ start:420 stop:857 length:438 start_codon:yes stop_codon:yes gene_type:complete
LNLRLVANNAHKLSGVAILLEVQIVRIRVTELAEIASAKVEIFKRLAVNLQPRVARIKMPDQSQFPVGKARDLTAHGLGHVPMFGLNLRSRVHLIASNLNEKRKKHRGEKRAEKQSKQHAIEPSENVLGLAVWIFHFAALKTAAK